MNASKLVDELAKLQLPNVFNPYRDKCVVADHDRSCAIRKQNLVSFIEAAALRGGALWIARDLGYRGGRRTGVAMTDEVHLEVLNKRWGLALKKATAGPIVIERTARAVWDQIISNAEFPFLWNVFPLHPHEPEDPFTNRKHNVTEREVGLRIISQVVELISPSKIVTIGSDARTALRRLGISATCVRHPSYGGEREFAKGIRDSVRHNLVTQN